MGALQEVSAGVFRVELEVPFGNGTANSYLISNGRSGIVIDAGAESEENRQTFMDSLKSVGLKPGDIKAVLVTHSHPDHWGLAEWLKQVCGAPVYASGEEARMLQAWRNGGSEHFSRIERFFEKHGMPPEKLEVVGALRRRAMRLGTPPRVDVVVGEGEVVEASDAPGLRVVALLTPGHSLGHTCYWWPEKGVVFCGDHVLPDITPNVGAALGDESVDALGLYLCSLTRLERVGAELGLPGHGAPFRDIAGRIGEIRAHHKQRLANVAKAVSEGAGTLYQVVQVLFHSEMTPIDYQLAFYEVYAHLEALVRDGILARREANGRIAYRSELQ